jgi:DNA-binding response OmpR family regulator
MNRKVLVVGASAAEWQSIRFILSRDEILVDLALSCSEAHDLLSRNDFDLIIVDEALEGFSLEAMLSELRSDTSQFRVPILLLTGEENADELIYSDGEIECRRVAKPFSSDSLRNAVEQVVRR